MCEVIVCERWYVTKLCVCVWSYVCDRWYVTKLCVKFVCVKYGMWQSCMLSLCVCEVIVCERWCVTGGRRREAGGGRREAGAARDTESKTRTPHKVVGNKAILRDIRKKWKFTAPKWYMSAGLLQNSKFARSKTKQFCETSFKNEKLSAELTASCQCGLWFCCSCVRSIAPATEKQPGHTKCCTCHTESC